MGARLLGATVGLYSPPIRPGKVADRVVRTWRWHEPTDWRRPSARGTPDRDGEEQPAGKQGEAAERGNRAEYPDAAERQGVKSTTEDQDADDEEPAGQHERARGPT